MNIIISTQDAKFYSTLLSVNKDSDYQITNAKSDSLLFDLIENGEGDAYIISDSFNFCQKAADFIKKSDPYIPVIFLRDINKTTPITRNVDIIIPDKIYSTYEEFASIIMHNINTYVNNFTILKKLTAKIHDKIEFANCVYDPTRRLLYHKGKEIKKLSSKEGGILEILAINHGKVVKKDVILEKVWRKTDYFAGRSMDVYITYLRNTLKNNKIKLTIKNITGIGLILE